MLICIKISNINSLSIILPCFNPLPNWENTVIDNYQKIKDLLPLVHVEIILVNDGSTKNVNQKQIQLLQNKIKDFNFISYKLNKGKGFAVRKGASAAKFDYLVYTDIDFPYKNNAFKKIIKGLNSGADIISFIRDENYYNKIPILRRLISKVLRFMLKKFFELPIDDTQTGLKAFSKAGKLLLLKTQIERYLFDIELFKLAGRQNDIKIKTYKVQLKDKTVLTALSLKLIFSELKTFYKIWRL